MVSINPRYYRPTEVDFLLGDPSKAKEKLGWEPKTSLKELISLKLLHLKLLQKNPKRN